MPFSREIVFPSGPPKSGSLGSVVLVAVGVDDVVGVAVAVAVPVAVNVDIAVPVA
jgi:hypothetical protein